MRKFWPLLILVLVLLLPANCLLRDRAFVLDFGANIQSFNASKVGKQLADRFDVELADVYFSLENFSFEITKAGGIGDLKVDFSVPVKGQFHHYQLIDKKVLIVDGNLQALELFRLPATDLFAALANTPWDEVLAQLPEADRYLLEFDQFMPSYSPNLLPDGFYNSCLFVNDAGVVVRSDLNSISLAGPAIIAKYIPLTAEGQAVIVTRDELLLLRP